MKKKELLLRKQLKRDLEKGNRKHMIMTKEKKNEEKLLLLKLSQINQNMQSNLNNTEQLRNFSNSVRNQRSERPISLEELNMIKIENGNYRYGAKRL